MDKLLQRALADISDLLQRRDMVFALVGGIAASLRGRLRATEDIGLILMTDVDGALQLASELDGTPFGPLFPEFEKVVRRAYILALEHRPTGVPIDLAIGSSGFEQQVVSRASQVEVADSSIRVATAEDLILMKLLADRPQDHQDISGIIAAQRTAIDWKYCESVAKQLEEVIERELVTQVSKLRQQ